MIKHIIFLVVILLGIKIANSQSMQSPLMVIINDAKEMVSRGYLSEKDIPEFIRQQQTAFDKVANVVDYAQYDYQQSIMYWTIDDWTNSYDKKYTRTDWVMVWYSYQEVIAEIETVNK